MNPLLNKVLGTPHETIPFDRLTPKDYEEAIRKGMELEDEEIRLITDNPHPPTFQNTIAPSTGEILERASTAFFNLLNAETSDEMDEIATRLMPELTEHSSRILHNKKLFARIKHVHEKATRLNPEEQMLLDKSYESLVRSGADLNEKDKKELEALNVELSKRTIQFDQNILKETNCFQLHITDETDLKGLPDSAIETGAEAAREKGLDGWIYTLHAPSYVPFITYAENRALREKIYRAKNSIGCKDNEFDNRGLIRDIVNLRLKMARLLGYPDYASYALKTRMAENSGHVRHLLNQLLDAYLPKAKEEMAMLTALAKEENGPEFELRPWDIGYYRHKLKLKKYSLDAEMLRPYFELGRVKEGIFGLANRLYGLTFEPRIDIPVYHPDVDTYEVHDGDGRFLAILYADFFPRKSKQGGAWMTEFREQHLREDGSDCRPHVSIVMNLTKPTQEKPSLLTLGEVETFIHEFGHALHGMLSQCRFQSLSGTNVYRDFVELPSQFMENYVVEPEFLHTFARHYQTGEPLPEELIRKVTESRNFMCGYDCIRQLSFGLLDMAYYTQTEELKADIMDFEQEAMKPTALMPALPEMCMSTAFQHIMSGGYSAGYYSYKWAEVLDADAFSLFRKNGIFDKETAQKFRKNILERGGTEPPMDLYIRFKGQEPTIDALLCRNGLHTI